MTKLKKKEILVVSFGTSYSDNRRLSIEETENTIRNYFKDWRVERAFTSQTIINILKKRENVVIKNAAEALDDAIRNGIKTVIVQPTHMLPGIEYGKLKELVQLYKNRFDEISLGKPLLYDDDDFYHVMEAIVEDTTSFDDGKTAICFMGHGTEVQANDVYLKMQELLKKCGHENYYIGTVEAAPTVDDLLIAIKGKTYTKVLIQPFMIVAGDHANNDMAGNEEDSWKSKFTNAGYEVFTVLKGLGELEKIQKIYLSHILKLDQQ